MDKIVQGNTSNIIFLKSTDDSMIDTLQKMSGTTHRSYVDSKTVTRDNERLMFKNEGKTSYTMTTREEPVIKYNDMAFIGERNSIVFRAGDNPIWNRNETILPMSWRLFQNNIKHPGHSYSLQTIPTLSTVKDFDVRKNQPDFMKMLDKRMNQAIESAKAQEEYRNIYGYSDYEIEQLDPDDYADEIMGVINIALREGIDYDQAGDDDPMGIRDYEEGYESFSKQAEDNPEQAKATQEMQVKYNVTGLSEKRFARGRLAPENFINEAGQVNRNLEGVIVKAYKECKAEMRNDVEHFVERNGNLYDADSNTLYIKTIDESKDLQAVSDAAKDADTSVYSEDTGEKIGDIKELGSYSVTDAFFRFLAKQKSWTFADGRFEEEMIKAMES